MRKIIFLFLFFFLSGCTPVSVSLYNKNIHYPATDPQTVRVIQKKPVDKKFTEIGEVTVDGAADITGAERIFKIKAAEFGGDAVYIYDIVERLSSYVSPHPCHFYEDYQYPHGRYFPSERYTHYPSYYPNYYYYCYGYSAVNTTVFLTVVGIIIKFEQ